MRKLFKYAFIVGVILFVAFASENICFAGPRARLTYSGEAGAIYNDAVRAYRTRHFTLAIKSFKKVIESYPDDGYAQISRSNLAQIYAANHEYENAIALYKEMLDRMSDNQDEGNKIRLELCQLLYTLHRYREGIEILEAWQKQEPFNSECARKLSSFYLSTGRKDEAWLLLERFMELSNKEAFKDLLDVAVRSGEVDKLINTLETRRAKYKSIVFSDFISDCYLALGRKDKAIEALKEIKDYQKQTVILRKLANIQIADNKIDDAIVTLETLGRLLPFDNQSLKMLGHCYFLKGNRDKAISTWQKLLQGHNFRNQQAYMDYTSVLIEHQLLEEALEGFEDARNNLFINNIFAEEKAAVLMALNRKAEAMEEYLKVLMQGTYKTDIFNKLYDADGKDFDLEKRLVDLKANDYSSAIIQSLLEFYFRKSRMADINKVLSLADNQSAIFFDDLFYNRLRQEALLVPEQFHFELAKRIMDYRAESELELKLAALLLKMPEYNEKWLLEAYEKAKAVAESSVIADGELKYELCLRLAEFAFYTMKKPEDANKYLGIILRRNQLQPSLGQKIKAKLFRAKIYVYTEKYADAEKSIEEAGKLIENAKSNAYALSLEVEELVMQKLFEESLLKSHKGDFQNALNSLKSIVEDHKEGYWVNDALELANNITRLSLGVDFNVLKHRLTAERAFYCGKTETALSELKEAINAVPASSTAIISEFEADTLLYSDKNQYDKKLIKSIGDFIAKHKDCFKNPDLLDLKIRLMQRGNESQDLIKEEMRGFINKYSDDLRAGKYRQSLENGGSKL